MTRTAFWSSLKLSFIFLGPVSGSAGFFGRSGDGARGPAVLILDPSARSAALGEAVVASEGGASGVFSNPGSLGDSDRSELFLSHTAFGTDQSLTAFSCTRPYWRGERRAWGISLALLQTDPIDLVVEDVPQGRVRPLEGVLAVSVARPLGSFAGGVSVKAIHQDLGGATATTAALDLGLSNAGSDRPFAWGLALRNIGPGLNWGERHPGLPTVLKVGAERRFRRAAVSTQLDWPAGRNPLPRLGGSWRAAAWKGKSLSLLAGWAGGDRAPSEKWIPSLGWGLELGSGRLHYALTPRDGGAAFHRMDVAFHLGPPLPQESARAEALHRARAEMAAGRWLAARRIVTDLTEESPRDPVLRRLAADIERGFTESLDPEALLLRGREALAAGRFDAATDAFRTLLIVDPKNAAAAEGLGRTEKQRASAEEARARGQVNDTRRRELRRWTDGAQAAMADRRWPEALDFWRRVLSLDPSRKDAAAGRDRCAAEARAQAQKTYTGGMAAYAAGRLEEALAHFRAARAQDPEDKNILRALERAEEEWRRR